MLAKHALLGAVLLAVHGPTFAQQAELLHFDGTRDDVVIHVGRPSPIGAALVADDHSDLSATLAADFGLIGAPQANYAPPPPSSIDVPQWMRSGVRPATFGTGGQLAPQIAAGCGPVQYRPRGDLPASTERRRAQLFPLIAAIACEQRIPVGLFDALIAQESRYHHGALSPKGAIGLAQLMPGTASYLGVTNPWDVTENLRGGARYLREQIDEFGQYDLALAAYNAGPGRVRTHRRIPRIRETLEYVRNITAAWSYHEKQAGMGLGSYRSRVAVRMSSAATVSSYTSTSVANPR